MSSLEQRSCSSITIVSSQPYARESNMIREKLEDHTSRSDGAPWVLERSDNRRSLQGRDRKRGRSNDISGTGYDRRGRSPKRTKWDTKSMTVDTDYRIYYERKGRQQKRGRSNGELLTSGSDACADHRVRLRKRGRCVEESLSGDSDLVARIRGLEAKLREKNFRIRSLGVELASCKMRLGIHFPTSAELLKQQQAYAAREVLSASEWRFFGQSAPGNGFRSDDVTFHASYANLPDFQEEGTQMVYMMHAERTVTAEDVDDFKKRCAIAFPGLEITKEILTEMARVADEVGFKRPLSHVSFRDLTDKEIEDMADKAIAPDQWNAWVLLKSVSLHIQCDGFRRFDYFSL